MGTSRWAALGMMGLLACAGGGAEGAKHTAAQRPVNTPPNPAVGPTGRPAIVPEASEMGADTFAPRPTVVMPSTDHNLAASPELLDVDPNLEPKPEPEIADTELPLVANAGENPRPPVEPSSAPDTSDKTLPTPAETELRERVQRALLAKKSLSYNEKHVSIDVDAHTVTLRGEVRTAQEKLRVRDIVADVSGVKQVRNQLVVINQAPQATHERAIP